jgi:hypothetical protein
MLQHQPCKLTLAQNGASRRDTLQKPGYCTVANGITPPPQITEAFSHMLPIADTCKQAAYNSCTLQLKIA